VFERHEFYGVTDRGVRLGWGRGQRHDNGTLTLIRKPFAQLGQGGGRRSMGRTVSANQAGETQRRE